MPLVRHSCAPITPSNSRSETTDGPSRRAVGFRAGLPDVGRAPQRDAVVRVERDQQHAERARALRPRLAMQMEGFGGRWATSLGRGRLFRLARRAVGAARQRRQHLPRVLEVAAPQQRRALAREAVRVVGRHAVVGDRPRASGGGAPRSERQRAERASPPSVQCTTGCASTLEFRVLLAGAARLVRRILRGVRDELALGRGDRIDAQLVARAGSGTAARRRSRRSPPPALRARGSRLCASVSHWKISSSSPASADSAIARFLGEWNWSQSRAAANARSCSRRSSSSVTFVPRCVRAARSELLVAPQVAPLAHRQRPERHAAAAHALQARSP